MQKLHYNAQQCTTGAHKMPTVILFLKVISKVACPRERQSSPVPALLKITQVIEHIEKFTSRPRSSSCPSKFARLPYPSAGSVVWSIRPTIHSLIGALLIANRSPSVKPTSGIRLNSISMRFRCCAGESKTRNHGRYQKIWCEDIICGCRSAFYAGKYLWWTAKPVIRGWPKLWLSYPYRSKKMAT